MGQQSSHVDSDASGSKQIVDVVGGTRSGASSSQAENGLNTDAQPQRSRVDKIFRRASSTLNTRIKGRDRSSSPGNARSSKAAKQALRGSPRDSEPESSLLSERRKDSEAVRSAGAKDSGSVEELDRGSNFKDNSALEKSFLQTGELDLDEIILLDARRSVPLTSISSCMPDISDSDSAAMGNLNTAKCFAPSRLAASSEVFNGHGQAKGRGNQNQKSVAPGTTGNVLLSQEPRPPELGSYLTVAPVVSPGDMGLSPIDEITEAPTNYARGLNIAGRNSAAEAGSALKNAHQKEEMHVTKTENLSKNLSQGDVKPSGILLSTGNTASLSLNLQKTDLSHDGILGSADSSGSAVVSPDIFADAASVVTDKSPFESPYTSAAENSTVELDDSPEMVDESQKTSSQTLTPSDVDDDASLLPRVKSVSLDKIDNSECSSDCYPRGHRATEAGNSAATSSLPLTHRKHSHLESNSKGRRVGHGSENVSTMQEGQRPLPISDCDRKNGSDAHSKYSVSLEMGIESAQLREKRPHQATGSRRRSEFSSEDFQQETDTSTENIPKEYKRVSRSSSSTSQSKHRNRYSSESSQQMSDSEEMQRSTTFKSSSRTFSQLSLDEVVAVPKTVPEKLDFQQLEKFEGKHEDFSLYLNS